MLRPRDGFSLIRKTNGLEDGRRRKSLCCGCRYRERFMSSLSSSLLSRESCCCGSGSEVRDGSRRLHLKCWLAYGPLAACAAFGMTSSRELASYFIPPLL